MFNEIMDAVGRRLEELFPGCAVYTDGEEQGLEGPYFFTAFTVSAERPVTGQRYCRETGVYIRYFPGAAEQPSREFNRTADMLFDGMEIITLADGSQMRGTQKNCKAANGALEFYVNFNSHVVRQKAPGPVMEDAGVTADVKG